MSKPQITVTIDGIVYEPVCEAQSYTKPDDQSQLTQVLHEIALQRDIAAAGAQALDKLVKDLKTKYGIDVPPSKGVL